MKGFPVNSIESNRNWVHPPDELDEGLNLIGENTQKPHPHHSFLKKLKNLFGISKQKKFENQNIKQALILMEMGDFFKGNGNRAQAKVNYEAAILLLEEEPGHALKYALEHKLELLDVDNKYS